METPRNASPEFLLDRQQLQSLIDLLNRYDLSDDSRTDNSDLCAQLRALVPMPH